jgi:hypothetical protein
MKRQDKLYRHIVNDLLKKSSLRDNLYVQVRGLVNTFGYFFLSGVDLMDYEVGKSVIIPNYGEMYGLVEGDCKPIWDLYRKKLEKIIRHEKSHKKIIQNGRYHR